MGTHSKTYVLLSAPNGAPEGSPAIRCLVCGLTSLHPRDVSERFCGCCYRFHDDAQRAPIAPGGIVSSREQATAAAREAASRRLWSRLLRPHPRVFGPTADAADLGPQLFVGDRPDPARFLPPAMGGDRPLGKPSGGLWTSPLVDRDGEAWSPWLEWCFGEMESVLAQPRWRLDPDPAARIARIDGVPDLAALVARYPYAGAPWADFWPEIDYAAAAADLDAIHLTERGQHATRFSVPSLYGWDCACTLFLRWCFAGEPVLLRCETGAAHEETAS